MTTRRQFALILLSTVALASLASHAAIRLFGLETEAIRNEEFGLNFHSHPIVVAGSSLIGYGFDWDLIAKDFSRHIIRITTPAASPCELEVLQAEVPETDFTIIGISVSDMDEDVISDFRANVVPFTWTWRDLRGSGADGTLVRRTISQYPLWYARLLFPTAGRSVGLLVSFRRVARELMHRHAGSESDPLPTFNDSSGFPTNRISDWDRGRVLRNVESQRVACGGNHSFSGPKQLALERMLRWAAVRGKVVVVVIPESPLYQQEVIDPLVTQSFEKALADMAGRVPAAKWIRMDRIPGLRSNELYWDLVHLNAEARPLATAELLKQLEPIMRAP
jgi:hypothetical protein